MCVVMLLENASLFDVLNLSWYFCPEEKYGEADCCIDRNSNMRKTIVELDRDLVEMNLTAATSRPAAVGLNRSLPEAISQKKYSTSY